jgi:hypothetical protein
LSEPTHRWQDVLAAEPVNATRAELYRRLMDAQERITRSAYARGISDERVQRALDTVGERLTDAQRRDDLYLAALGEYVAALGGRLEVRAILGDEEIVVRRAPDEPAVTGSG